jgi:hypothetical protein
MEKGMNVLEPTINKPTPTELLAGYQRFNVWEAQEQMIYLPSLSIGEGLIQFFQLRSLVLQLTGAGDRFVINQNKAQWISYLAIRQKAARTMGHAQPTTSIARSQDLS